MKRNQKINCNVSTCTFNDCNNSECSLNEIKVSCDYNNDKVKEKSDTICSSFKTKEKE